MVIKPGFIVCERGEAQQMKFLIAVLPGAQATDLAGAQCRWDLTIKQRFDETLQFLKIHAPFVAVGDVSTVDALGLARPVLASPGIGQRGQQVKTWYDYLFCHFVIRLSC